MMLLEHDAKRLLEASGVRVPSGFLTERAGQLPAGSSGPWIVKAQVPVGGRGKAGAILRVDSVRGVSEAVQRVLGMAVKGHRVHACRVEEAVAGVECYFAIALDAGCGRLRVLLSSAGGVDVEANAGRGAVLSAESRGTTASVLEAIGDLVSALPPPLSAALRDAAAALAPVFFRYEATLLEINPLFVRSDGTWVAGDAKLVVDDNALVRQPAIADLVRQRRDDYPELALKLDAGFDFVVLDADGEIGLVTTGAGLSMQLVDELAVRGVRAFNFCDIRTGQFRGDPSRLIRVFQRMASAPAVGSVLINFFAGITHLGEIAHVLLAALKDVPELRVPVTARLIGNGLDEALAVLRRADVPLTIETDLEAAIVSAIRPLRRDER